MEWVWNCIHQIEIKFKRWYDRFRKGMEGVAWAIYMMGRSGQY